MWRNPQVCYHPRISRLYLRISGFSQALRCPRSHAPPAIGGKRIYGESRYVRLMGPPLSSIEDRVSPHFWSVWGTDTEISPYGRAHMGWSGKRSGERASTNKASERKTRWVLYDVAYFLFCYCVT